MVWHTAASSASLGPQMPNQETLLMLLSMACCRLSRTRRHAASPSFKALPFTPLCVRCADTSLLDVGTGSALRGIFLIICVLKDITAETTCRSEALLMTGLPSSSSRWVSCVDASRSCGNCAPKADGNPVTDGGGIRGLSSLIIVKHLMKRVNPQNPPRPCDYFDLIGGTSTGGYATS